MDILLNKNKMKEEIEKILEERPLLLDGAMGTMLQGQGLKSGDCPEKWNIINPQIVKKIHYDYINAGSDIVLTNTFGANRIKLNNYNIGADVSSINESAVRISREAITKSNHSHRKVYLAGSIGPTGKILEPYGELSFQKAYENYKEQVLILAEEGIDLVILETFYDLEEIKSALKAVKENTDLMVIASMTFDKNLKTIYGITPEKAAMTLEKEGADGIGANCGTGPDIMYEVLKLMKKVSTHYLLAEPNAGIPELVDGKIFYPASPKKMADYAKKFKDLGIDMIGGCCGTTPLHVKAMFDKMNAISM